MGRPRKQCDCCVVCEEYKRTSQLLLQSSTSRLAVFYCTFLVVFGVFYYLDPFRCLTFLQIAIVFFFLLTSSLPLLPLHFSHFFSPFLWPMDNPNSSNPKTQLNSSSVSFQLNQRLQLIENQPQQPAPAPQGQQQPQLPQQQQQPQPRSAASDFRLRVHPRTSLRRLQGTF